MKIKKIKKIKLSTPEILYDITASEFSNFLLENGIVVHNCGDALAGSIDAIQRDLDLFTRMSNKFVEKQFTEMYKRKVFSEKSSVEEDLKNILKDGGMERFMKRQQFRNEQDSVLKTNTTLFNEKKGVDNKK